MQYTAIYQAIAHSLAVEPVAGKQGGLMGFSPKSLFASGAQGAWYDPSDLTTLFEDSAGTTPITSPLEKPVGLMLDKSRGLVLGSELVTNGDFSNGTTGWTITASATVSAGALSVSSVSFENFAANTATLPNDSRWYAVSFDVTVISGQIGVFISQIAAANKFTGQNIATSGRKTGYVFNGSPGAGNNTIIFRSEGGFVGTIDNISVRELPGNHATQAVTTSRPILSARKNKLVGTATLATQSVTTTAVGHVLSFWGTGTVTLSGTATGSLVGTGVNDRVSLTFTPTAGTLTLTVTGSVLKAQLEEINETV